MHAYEVTYDLSGAAPSDYTALRKFFEQMDSWHDEYSAWFVSFAGTADQLFALLRPLVGSHDHLTVAEVHELTTRYHFGGYNWLREHGVRATAKV